MIADYSLTRLDEAIDNPQKLNVYNTSVLLIGLITFVGDCSRGVLFPVLWPLSQNLGGSIIQMGYLVSIFSVGRLIVTTPFGYFCDVYRHRFSLIIANVILLAGAFLWANTLPTKSIGVLYFAQFLMGCGSGSLGVTRSFIVEQVDPKHRTHTLALLTAIQYAGFTVSPFVGSLLSIIGHNGYWKFALPAYFIACLCILCLAGLILFFKDLPAVVKQPIVVEANTIENPMVEHEQLPDASNIKYIIGGMMLLNVSSKGSIAVYETLGSQIGIVDYNLSSLELGALISICGVVGFAQLLLFDKVWCKHFTDIQLMRGGILTMIIAQIFIINYGSIPDLGGYVISVILMYAFGYPIGHTAVLGAFSKIQKTGPQAAMMGWFATVGSLARAIIPIMSGKHEHLIIAMIFFNLSSIM